MHYVYFNLNISLVRSIYRHLFFVCLFFGLLSLNENCCLWLHLLILNESSMSIWYILYMYCTWQKGQQHKRAKQQCNRMMKWKAYRFFFYIYINTYFFHFIFCLVLDPKLSVNKERREQTIAFFTILIWMLIIFFGTKIFCFVVKWEKKRKNYLQQKRKSVEYELMVKRYWRNDSYYESMYPIFTNINQDNIPIEHSDK